MGAIYVDVNGAFWVCVATSPFSNLPSTWKQVATTDQGLHAFTSHHRVYGDGSVIPAGTTTAAIDATAGGVPAGAKSAYCAVQASASAPGPLTLFPDGAEDPGIANYTALVPNTLNLFYMLVPLSAAGKFKIHTYITGQIYVDVWGYLLQL